MTRVPAETEAILAAQVRAWRWQLRGGGALLVAVSLLGAAILLAMHGTGGFVGNARASQALALSTLGVPMGLVLVGMGLRSPHRHRVLDALRAFPEDVVWTYVVPAPPPRPLWVAKATRSFPFGKLCLGWKSRAILELPIEYGAEALVARAVEVALPHATHGYTAERAAAFQRDPQALRCG